MRVKKFEAKSMKDALQMVKNELGPDAVILAARDNRKTYGIGGQASVEITAAVSDSTLQKKKFVESRMTDRDRARFQGSDARTQREIISHVVDGRTRQLEQKTKAAPRPITTTSYIDIPDEVEPTPRRREAMSQARGRNVRELLADFEQDFEEEIWQEKSARQAGRETQAAPARSRAEPRPEARQYEQRQHEARQTDPRRAPVTSDDRRRAAPENYEAQDYPEQRPQVSETALARIRTAAREAFSSGGLDMHPSSQGATQAPAPKAAPQIAAPNNVEVNSLKSEIDRLHKVIEGFQKMPQTFTSLHPGADFGLPFDLSFMFEKLTQAGVTIDQTVDLLQIAGKEIDPAQMKKRPIVDAWVARYLLTNTQIVAQPWAGRVHQFVGGAGSGKTSALVKMASHLVVKEKKKVAILSTDAYKVGAIDQLKIYCQILNVPFACVRNRKDWEYVLSQLSHVDHVLVDFPGFQLRDLEEIQTVRSLLAPPEAQAITHFCASATAKDGDAFEIARRYKVADYNDLIVTNLDQSVQHGIIYNLQTKTGKRLHSFGTGNRIPEDFELATKERVLDLIFKLTKLRKETSK